MHPDLSDWICKWGYSKEISPQQHVVGDLEMITFYYILCVGEYTAPKLRGQQLRTQQFFVNDVSFFKLRNNCGFLSPLTLNTSKHELLSEVAATLSITEQKNLFKGA